MSFGISESVRSRAVQVCTPQLFHQAAQSGVVVKTCAEIEDALESLRRGEMSKDDYVALKTKLKAKLPILTPHATFKNGRRLNADAIPSGLSIYDKDHIPDPRGWWKTKSQELKKNKPEVLECILLVHVTPSLEGLRLVFVIPGGMNLADAQKWMSEQLEDKDYDSCVKDLARPSFIVPEDYILFINEEELFKDREAATPSRENGELKGDGAWKAPERGLPDGRPEGAAEGSGAAAEGSTGAGSKKAAAEGSTGAESGAAESKKAPASYPKEYQGVPYPVIIEKLIELLGGEPQHGSRNSFIFTLSCYLRYLCDDNAEWIKQVIPTFGEDRKRAFITVESACNRKQSYRMPSIVSKAVELVRNEEMNTLSANYDDSDFGDINNPESYFYHIHQMPEKLPKLIRLLISKTPGIYRPAVSQACLLYTSDAADE